MGDIESDMWRESGKSEFPPDRDLSPEDVSITTIIRPGLSDTEAKWIIRNLRKAYKVPCDLIVIAVPQGKGKPFAEGLKEALEKHGKLQGEIDL